MDVFLKHVLRIRQWRFCKSLWLARIALDRDLSFSIYGVLQTG